MDTNMDAVEWIKRNPHQALGIAVRAHRAWHGCLCKLWEIGRDPEFCRKYRIENVYAEDKAEVSENEL